MARQLLLGYDIGSSFIKAALVDAKSGALVNSAQSPKQEMAIDAPYAGWAEQHPETWWTNVVAATRELLMGESALAEDVSAIGISYQMHGLVIVDKELKVLRPSIIWCDSRAVEIGNKAFADLGADHCLGHYLNSPGNFTASKLKWVKESEPDVYARISKFMLPGDFVAMKLTGEVCTTVSGLSEGVFWDFRNGSMASTLMEHYGLDRKLIAQVVPTFGNQGKVSGKAAQELGLKPGIPVSYRAGDQPNNAFSLNVLEPGEVAATAGTSGVVYGVVDRLTSDPLSRVNLFAHVNHAPEHIRLGVLLCINGTGIQNSWLRKTMGGNRTYEMMSAEAGGIKPGSDGLTVLPFGNGAERVFENRTVGGRVIGLDFNRHGAAHLFRAAQEGIAFAFKYGVDVMNGMGLKTSVIRAGEANLFLSPVFRQALATITGAAIELYSTDGAQGAARGAAVGSGISSMGDAFRSLRAIALVSPDQDLAERYREAYEFWLNRLNASLSEPGTQ